MVYACTACDYGSLAVTITATDAGGLPIPTFEFFLGKMCWEKFQNES